MKQFIKTTVIGGVIVILPIVLIWFLIRWLFMTVTDLIQPLTDIAIRQYQLPEFVGDLVVIFIIVLGCFLVGLIVSTQVGKYLHALFDDSLQRLAPGYRMIKEVVVQILGSAENSPFSRGEVARVKLFGEDCATEVTALVTDRHDDGMVTVFMPTGPNPTSGNIYHVPESQVTLCPEIPLDSAMRTIIACGAGSKEIFSRKGLAD